LGGGGFDPPGLSPAGMGFGKPAGFPGIFILLASTFTPSCLRSAFLRLPCRLGRTRQACPPQSSAAAAAASGLSSLASSFRDSV